MQAQRCRARLDHLESADVESLSDWNNTRLNRILVDYMLRMSYYDTAAKLAESRNIQVVLISCPRLGEIIYCSVNSIVLPINYEFIEGLNIMNYCSLIVLE